jgi:serine/threonine-protein kinase
MLQVCEAIAHAQSHLIVHRDLKPSNIFVDVHGQPRVLDFGIAKLLTSDRGQDATAPDAAPETGTGSLLMSPADASPEQILGEPVSTATDVYALGLILFELLTEQRPHQRDVASIRALMANAQADITQSPSAVLKQRSHVTRPWKQINQDLDTIVLTALKRDPARRYFNAQTMADDLKRWQQGQPIAAQPDTRTYRIKRFVARNRVAVGSASAVFLALLVGLSVALWQAGMARAQARLAIAEYQRAEAARIESDRMILFIRARMGEGDPKLHQEGANLRLQTWLEQSLPKIESHLTDAPRVQIRMGTLFAGLLLEYGSFELALAGLDRVVSASDLLMRNNPEEASRSTAPGLLVEPLVLRARALSSVGRLKQASHDLDQAMARLARLPETPESKRLAITARGTMLTTSNRLGQFRKALDLARANLRARIALFGEDSAKLAVDYNNIGSTMTRLGMYVEAKANLQKSKQLLLTGPGSGGARPAIIDSHIAGIALAQGELDQAESLLRASHQYLAPRLPENHPDLMGLRGQQARLTILRGQAHDAEQITFELLAALDGAKLPWTREVLLLRAQVLIILKRADEALLICNRLEAEAAVDSELPSAPLSDSVCLLARVLAKQALKLDDRVIENVETMLKNDHAPSLSKGDAAIYLAATLHALGDDAQARAWAARASSWYQKSMTSENAQLRSTSLIPALGSPLSE